MNIKAYFNPATDLRAYRLNQSIFLRPFDETYLEEDLAALNMLAFDQEVKKYMSGFYGIEPDAVERRKEYLVNTIMTTQIGIAFAYSIRLNAGLCGWIKVTSPSHNIVTNNFSNWLIDFVTLPMFRNKNLMKASIPIILDLMRDDMDVEEVYAMVDSGNKASIHVLETVGFADTGNRQMAINESTGNKPYLYVYRM
ncbi:MAG: GNAT family N-acetyltransferase [Prevotella sp.]|nr:GNAT family N-acetyltransferase [Prevotella sp.]